MKTEVGKNIRTYRDKAGLTQAQLGKECGVTAAAIRHYELGLRSPDDEMISKISKALHVSPYAIANPDLSTEEGALHALFRIATKYKIVPFINEDRLSFEVELPYRFDFANEDEFEEAIMYRTQDEDDEDGDYSFLIDLWRWAYAYEKYHRPYREEMYYTWLSCYPDSMKYFYEKYEPEEPQGPMRS